MIERNFVKDKIRANLPVMGTWNTLASELVTEVLAHAGLDFLLIDFEHGPFEIGSIHRLVSACERYSSSPIVRIPTGSDWMVLQALDQGAHGVMVPHVEDKAGVQSLLASTRYHPKGTRGFTPFTKAGGFSNRRATSYVSRASDFVLSAILVESCRGLQNLDEILENANLDVVYFGAYDLSQEMGCSGGVRDARVVEVITKAVHKVVRAHKCAGGFVAESHDDVRRLLDIGIRFITYDVDSAILSRPVEDLVEWFRKEVGES